MYLCHDADTVVRMLRLSTPVTTRTFSVLADSISNPAPHSNNDEMRSTYKKSSKCFCGNSTTIHILGNVDLSVHTR